MGGLARWGVGPLCGESPSPATAHRLAHTGESADLISTERSQGQAQVER